MFPPGVVEWGFPEVLVFGFFEESVEGGFGDSGFFCAFLLEGWGQHGFCELFFDVIDFPRWRIGFGGFGIGPVVEGEVWVSFVDHVIVEDDAVGGEFWAVVIFAAGDDEFSIIVGVCWCDIDLATGSVVEAFGVSAEGDSVEAGDFFLSCFSGL